MNPDRERTLTEDLRELTADRPFRPDLDAVIRRGRELRRRRVALISGGGAAVVAAAAAIALTVAVGQGRVTPPRTDTALGSQETQLTAKIMSAMDAADANSTMGTVAKTASGTTETIVHKGWVLQTTWNSGGVKELVVFSQLSGLTTKNFVNKLLTLDYATNTATTETLVGDENASYPLAVFEGPMLPMAGSKLLGITSVDGQSAYEFAIQGGDGFDCRVWVSKETLLPLKETAHQGTTAYDYWWSYAPESAAAAKPPIPPGFVRTTVSVGWTPGQQ
ncbi:MAG TPA: hypothetical protein VMG13_02850 [Trebonia sp.]|nr:hypothetical protein [Trebonia sp.]